MTIGAAGCNPDLIVIDKRAAKYVQILDIENLRRLVGHPDRKETSLLRIN